MGMTHVITIQLKSVKITQIYLKHKNTCFVMSEGCTAHKWRNN